MKVKNQYLKILEYLHLSFNKWPSIQYKFWVSLVIWNHNNVDNHSSPPSYLLRHWRVPNYVFDVISVVYVQGGGGGEHGQKLCNKRYLCLGESVHMHCDTL